MRQYWVHFLNNNYFYTEGITKCEQMYDDFKLKEMKKPWKAAVDLT